MADTTFHLEIITPEKVFSTEEVNSLEVPGVDGEFQILAGHTPFLTGIAVGPLVYKIRDKKTFVSVSGGFCEVQPHKTVILAHTAERSDKINIERAKKAQERAKKRIDSGNADIDMERAHAALARAINRIQVAGMK